MILRELLNVLQFTTKIKIEQQEYINRNYIPHEMYNRKILKIGVVQNEETTKILNVLLDKLK